MPPEDEADGIEAAFEELVALGPEGASAALERIRDRDPALWRELSPLIRSYIIRKSGVGAAAVSSNSVPAVPDRFHVIRSLGSGGFGHVYQARDTRYGVVVALKVLNASQSSSLRRFKEEFSTLSSVARHPNLVTLYDGFFDRIPWMFTMEYVDGTDVLTFVNAATASERVERVRMCLRQLAEGIHALHAERCFHRDVKPSNVLVTADGQVKLIDFGLVREFGDHVEVRVSLAGTLAYMSPEQLTRGVMTAASDWYAVGVVLYELLTTQKPFSSGPRNAPLEFPADTPEDLRDVCARLLCFDPLQRASYGDVASLDAAPASEFNEAPSEPESVFVGRARERALVRDAFRSSRSRPVVVHLSGPSGIGKSTFLRELHGDLLGDDPDALVLASRCQPNRSVPHPALDDLVDCLSRRLGELSRERIEAILPRHFSALSRMFPVLAHVQSPSNMPAEIESTELRLRGLAALGELLGRLSERSPVVLTIDDLQWGDLGGCTFLMDLMSSSFAPCLLLILSYRADAGDVASWLERTHVGGPQSMAAEHRVRLELLTADEAAQLARRLLRPSMSGHTALVDEMVEVSGHDPYLVHQIAQWANSQPAGSVDIQRVTATDGLRSTVDALSADSRLLLEIVAVAEQPTDVDDLRFTGIANVLQAREELRRARLTRSRVFEGREQMEVYHARIRDVMLQSLAAPAVVERNRQMAEILLGSEHRDVERIAIHLERAGEPDRCAPYARLAGNQAFRALAFERAALFYKSALASTRFEGEERLAVLRSLAEASANSGRCADAARAYGEAAAVSGWPQQLALTAQAADQLLRGGYVQEGLAMLDGVMARLRLKPPRSRTLSLVQIALLRGWLAVRGLSFERRGDRQLTLQQGLRLDVCWTGAMATSLVDPIRSAASSARYVLMALASGEIDHIATALSCEAPLVCLTSRHGQANARRLLDRVKGLSEASHVPAVHGRYLVSEMLVAFVNGDWRAAASTGDSAEEWLRTRCVNVTWELATAQIFSCAARYIRGAWAENHERLEQYIRAADARGDSNIAVMLRVFGCRYLSLLAEDRPAEAMRRLREDRSTFSHDRDDFFRCNVLQAEVDIALYENDPTRAHEAIERDWERLERALLLKNQTTFAFLHFARGRAVLAMANQVPEPQRRDALLGRADTSARALERRGPRWSRGMSHVLRAGVASWREGDASVDVHLRAAEQALADADIQSVRVATAYRLARHGDRDGRHHQMVREWTVSQGVKRIDRVAAALVPGSYIATSI
jgi:serine/threonine protein kinase